ncbi:MAG: transposase [Nanoarchaeota archaeon]|nr:transposase [Nanoarchaeota archaeon]
MKKLVYKKTLKVPVHFETNKEKISKLDKITARLAYAVRLWGRVIEENDIKYRKELQDLEYQHHVQEQTNLSSGYVQQAGNKALWMWKQYRTTYKNWECKIKRAKEGSKWYNKLLKRDPSEPFQSKKSLLKKIPVRLDCRTGNIKKAKLKLSSYVMNISTLKKYDKLTILLNPSQYHKKLLEQGEICDFEIVKKNKKYYTYITCQFEVSTQPIQYIRGIDLGVRRTLSDVLIDPKPIKFSNILDVEKKTKLKKLNNRISHLRRLQKWNILKQFRNLRNNYAIDRERKIAKNYAKKCINELVIIGHPKNIRYNNYKGNGNKKRRKMLQGWSFLRQAQFIKQKLNEKGILTEITCEWWTSKKCYKCNGIVTRNGPRIKCNDCNMQYDADYNACIKLAKKGTSYLSNKPFIEKAGATDELARTKDDYSQKSMSLETTSSTNS